MRMRFPNTSPLLPLLLAACSSTPEQAERRQLTLADFNAPSDHAPAQPTPPPAPPRAVITPEAARGGTTDVVVLAGPPPTPPPAPTDPDSERKLLVDQLVGQINGRPVYADEFFAPMDQRFRREAARLKPRDFLAFAKKEIEAALWDKLRDELLLAEFETGLSPEQRLGLIAFVEDVRDDLVRGNLGSSELARQRLLDTEGQDLEAKVEDVTQREFIAFQLKKSIGNRVNVAARDIALYYEQHLKDFAPPPTARFTILRVPVADATKIAEAEAALAAAEPFDRIASRLSTWRPDAANASEAEIDTADYATAALFGPAPLNDAAHALTPGQITPRIDFAGDAWWIRLAAIDAPPAKSLYEVQRDIEDKIRADRIREEERRYFDQLFRRGSFSDVKVMTTRLLEFAAERYLIQQPETPKAP